jgi:hypothetical protein
MLGRGCFVCYNLAHSTPWAELLGGGWRNECEPRRGPCGCEATPAGFLGLCHDLALRWPTTKLRVWAVGWGGRVAVRQPVAAAVVAEARCPARDWAVGRGPRRPERDRTRSSLFVTFYIPFIILPYPSPLINKYKGPRSIAFRNHTRPEAERNGTRTPGITSGPSYRSPFPAPASPPDPRTRELSYRRLSAAAARPLGRPPEGCGQTPA